MTENKDMNYRLNDIVMIIYVICQAAIVLYAGMVGGFSAGVILFFYLVAALFIGAIAFIPLSEKKSPLHFIRATYPLFLLLLFYYVSDAQARIFQIPPQDSFFIAIEKGLFGVYPSFALQRIMEIWLNDLSYIMYALGIVVPLMTIVILYSKANIRLFINYIFAMAVGGSICLLVSSIVPVTGPYRALRDFYYLGIYCDFTDFISYYINNLSAAYGAFPAIYFCIIAISSFYLWDLGKKYVYFTFVIMTSVFWGGVYLRYHYLLDGLVALVIAFIAIVTASYVHFRSSDKVGADFS
jgi:hypothetical protein